ncbi:DUF5324 family protein [Kitasatospora sp. LaBMicrA B282]|uniref:DUF5324 family protein n=1 Tax=Kitasatospora sp. LaBMicrA B282 TaxID=3420949 RepID=UPI003D0C8B42
MTRLATHLDTARETAGKTLDSLAPYAVGAKDNAAHYADEARQRLGPALEALAPRLEAAAEQARSAAGQARTGTRQAAHSARVGYTRHLAPHMEHAFAALPPKAQEGTLRAVHRAQEAALAAKHSADRATAQALPRLQEAKAAAGPAVQQAQSRGAAALTVLQGQVSPEQVNRLAAHNARKAKRNVVATSLAVGGAVAIGGGVLLWQWWRRQSEPEWLIEPPEVQHPLRTTHPASPDGSDAPVDGSGPAAAPDGEDQDQEGPGLA